MSATPLVLVGAGEHARVILDAARSRPDLWVMAGYCAPSASPELSGALGLSWLGDDADLAARAPAGARLVIGVGALGPSPKRRELVTRHEAARASWATVVHARAVVADSATLAPGVVVLAGAVVNPGAAVGAHAIINTGAIVEHDVRIGDFAIIGPGSVLGGGASVGEGAFIGLGSRVRDHISVGAGALVGMGAVVVGPVADGERVLGIPARPWR